MRRGVSSIIEDGAEAFLIGGADQSVGCAAKKSIRKRVVSDSVVPDRLGQNVVQDFSFDGLGCRRGTIRLGVGGREGEQKNAKGEG